MRQSVQEKDKMASRLWWFREEKILTTVVENVYRAPFGIVNDADKCRGLLIEVHFFRLLLLLATISIDIA